MSKILSKISTIKTMSKKKKKIIALMAGIALLITAAGYTVFIVPLLEQEQWIYKEAAVERGTLTVGVSESGALDYGITSILYELDLEITDEEEEEDNEEDNEAAVQKYLEIEEIYVASGQRIAADDAVLKFTEDSIEDVRRLLQSALVDARTSYNEAESEYNLSALETQTDYDTQRLARNYASSIYENASQSVSNDITALQVEIAQRTANIPTLEEKITQAREDYDEALADYQESEASMSQADISDVGNYMTMQSYFLNIRSTYQNAKSALTQAQQELADNADEIASLETQLATAQAKMAIEKLEVEETYLEAVINGDNAEITYNAQLEELKETLQEAEEEKTKVEEQMEAFEAFVGRDGILYAEGGGIVTQVAYEAGDSLIEPGVIISYAEPQNMTISVDVTQEDVVDLAVGDKVDIRFSAYEETPYEGTILSINTTATSDDSNTVSYEVIIGVEGDTEALYGGMTADITFVTEEKENVLYISKRAVVEENGRKYVYIKNALGGRELQEITTGISNGSSIEILSGLEEGDTIYIASRVSSEAEVENTQQEGDENAGVEAASGDMPNIVMPEGMGEMQIPDNMGNSFAMPEMRMEGR